VGLPGLPSKLSSLAPLTLRYSGSHSQRASPQRLPAARIFPTARLPSFADCDLKEGGSSPRFLPPLFRLFLWTFRRERLCGCSNRSVFGWPLAGRYTVQLRLRQGCLLQWNAEGASSEHFGQVRQKYVRHIVLIDVVSDNTVGVRINHSRNEEGPARGHVHNVPGSTRGRRDCSAFVRRDSAESSNGLHKLVGLGGCTSTGKADEVHSGEGGRSWRPRVRPHLGRRFREH
jgi:hypothetical protein